MSGLSLKELRKDLPSNYQYISRYANNTIKCHDTNTDEYVYRHFHQDIVRFNPRTKTFVLTLGGYAWSATTRQRVRWIVNELSGLYIGIYKSRRKNLDYEIYIYNVSNSKTYAFHDGFKIKKEFNRYPEINEYEVIYRKRKLVKTKNWCD